MINVVRGEDKTATINLSGVADLQTATAISVQFPTVGTTTVIKTLLSGAVVVVSATQLRVTIPRAETEIMSVGDDQSIEITIDYGSVREIVQGSELLNVASRLF